ncbi:flagellar filament capping protein FliD [Lachnospiraceae bacterium 54-53]
MASISSSTNINASSIRGYGGLASGLDRDSLIESMTSATRAKIAKQQQKKQTNLWQQEAYRSISSKLVEFSKKYTSYTSSSNLSSAAFWAASNITALGTNSKYISVSGSSSLTSSMSVVGVKQLAKEASMNSVNTVSDGILSTGDINLVNSDGTLTEEAVSNLEGQSLYIKYGSKSLGVSLGSGTTSDGFTYDYSNGKSAVESFTKALKNVSIGDGKTLADVISVTASSEGSDYKLNMTSKDTAGNTIMLTGGSQAALEALGVVTSGQSIDNVSDTDKTISAGGFSSTIMDRQDFFTDKTFAERVGGKSISFTYNGTTKSISFMDQDKLEAALSGITDNEDALEVIKNDLQTKLNKEFGTDRITVGVDGNKLTFNTTVPGTGADDTSSVLSISSGDTGVIGKSGALKVAYGESNRLNLTSALVDSGLDGIETALAGKTLDTNYFSGANKALEAIEALGSKVTESTTIDQLKSLIASNNPNMSDKDLSSINEAIDHFKTEGADTVDDLKSDMSSYVDERELKLTINGEKIKGLSYNSTLNEIINTINSSDADVTISYMKNADKFSIVSTAGGAAGSVDITGDDASMLFGTKDADYTVTDGQDAIVGVKYSGSDEVVELRRGNNAFSLDGLNITVNGKFGYNEDGSIIEDTEAITFSAKTDADKIVTAVSDMIKDFNEIIELVNSEVSTKPNREYEPLTDEQKEEMTDEQIEKWEEKAKTGLLFGDSDLRSLSDSLRFIFDSGSEEKAMLESFGISTSTSYGDNGKLVFDETKFRAALESNPDDLKELFTETKNDSTGDKGGVMARLTTITDKYAATTGATKGILIEKAGSTYAPTSILSNYLQKSIDSIDDYIERLQDKLETETDRYIKQFSNLETLISQMNSQSSWLSSSFSS